MADAKGAVDTRKCPKFPRVGNCRCGKCVRCGFQKHTGIHGPFYGKPPGSKPYGHEFKAALSADEKPEGR
jgi:hypothetical protein